MEMFVRVIGFLFYRVFGMSVLISGVLMIILSLIIKLGVIEVFVVRTLQGLVEVSFYILVICAFL